MACRKVCEPCTRGPRHLFHIASCELTLRGSGPLRCTQYLGRQLAASDGAQWATEGTPTIESVLSLHDRAFGKASFSNGGDCGCSLGPPTPPRGFG